MADHHDSPEKRTVPEPEAGSRTEPRDSDVSRRAFLKKLAYIPPAIETVTLLSGTAHAQAASPIGNDPPPPDPPPTVTGCSPSSASKNTTLNVTVTGTNFVATPSADFGSQIQVQNVSFGSSTSVIVTIRVNKNAKTGSRDVTITNPDSQSGTGLACFTVTT